MEELPDVYYLETIEQMRALADDLRQRILETINRQSMTVTQIGEALGVAPAKIHYHVRELERMGLVQLAETREKGGILEKYYLPVARGYLVPASLLRNSSLDETVQVTQEFMDSVALGVRRTLSRLVTDSSAEHHTFALQREHIWVTREEAREVMEKIAAAIAPFAAPRGVDGEKERTLTIIAYDTDHGMEDAGREDRTGVSTGTARGEGAEPKQRDSVVAGVVRYSAGDLRKFAERGEVLNLSVIGVCSFADDVPAQLVDDVVNRFRHRGQLIASPEVRDVLQRKPKGQSPRKEKATPAG